MGAKRNPFSGTDISLAENYFLFKLETWSHTKNLSFDPLDIILHVQKGQPVTEEPPYRAGYLVSDHILQ